MTRKDDTRREWFKRFLAAPNELRKAMLETKKAREAVELLRKQGVSVEKLRPHLQRLDDAEMHENQVAIKLRGMAPEPSDVRERPQPIDLNNLP
jgi:hypothetical protein